MEYLYHGSSVAGLTKLEPHKSTHGTYVYATPSKEISIIFSKRAGDDLTYSLFRNSKDEPYKLVERIPQGFEAMFSNAASIYKIDGTSFKNISTGFIEVVSEDGVKVLEEECIDNLYNKLLELESQNLIEIYRYPERPSSIPEDDSDLLNKTLKYGPTKQKFERLIFLHPNLLNKVNETITNHSLEFDLFTKDDLVNIYNNYINYQESEPNKEYFIKSALIQYSKNYPELITKSNQKQQVQTFVSVV